MNAVLPDFLEEIGLFYPVFLQFVDIFAQKEDVVVIDKNHPDTEYHEGNQVFVCYGLEKFFGDQGFHDNRQIFHTKLENLPAKKNKTDRTLSIGKEIRIGKIPGRYKGLLDGADRDPSQHVKDGSGLVVGA